MKNVYLLSFLSYCMVFISCSTDSTNELSDNQKTYTDYSDQMVNEIITLKTPDNRSVKAYLTKPEGSSIDIVIGLHGGSPTLGDSQSSTLGFAEKPDGGRQFIDNGYGVLAVEYTEFESDETKADRGFKELVDVLAAVDYILNDSLAKHKVTVDKVFAFGHSRGGSNALLAGIERPLDAVIGAEPPLDWIRTRDSIASGAISAENNLIQNFEVSVAAWDDADFIKYSAGLRLEEFKTKFMIISGELDVAVMIGIARDTQMDYQNCETCIDGGEFMLHEKGHTDWATVPGMLEAIQDFLK